MQRLLYAVVMHLEPYAWAYPFFAQRSVHFRDFAAFGFLEAPCRNLMFLYPWPLRLQPHLSISRLPAVKSTEI